MFLTLFISLILLILTIAVVFISLRITNYKFFTKAQQAKASSKLLYTQAFPFCLPAPSLQERAGGEVTILILIPNIQYTDHRQPKHIDDLARWQFQESLAFLA